MQFCRISINRRLALDADIAYLDTEHIRDMDEGLLIDAFLKTCRRLLRGSYLVLVTRAQEFDPADWGAESFVDVVLTAAVSLAHEDEANMWVCRIL